MNPSRFIARAPSNIALVKYMGKTDLQANLPENPSLSMTLGDLATWVEWSPEADAGPFHASWVPELPRLPETSRAALRLPLEVPKLSADGAARVLRHVERVRAALPAALEPCGLRARELRGEWRLRSANTFPPASGIASSASSFAATTLAVAYAGAADPAAFARAYAEDPRLPRSLAVLARQGSGSACRSFEGPWVEWRGERAERVPAELPELAHFVLLVSRGEKRVSSSQAHAWVKESPLWQGRPARATRRVDDLRAALAQGDWSAIARLTWSEAWEMHSLFHTCPEPFSYWEPRTMEILQRMVLAQRETPPPIVTLDAGPNVHVIVPARDRAAWRDRFTRELGGIEFLEDAPGRGASLAAGH